MDVDVGMAMDVDVDMAMDVAMEGARTLDPGHNEEKRREGHDGEHVDTTGEQLAHRRLGAE